MKQTSDDYPRAMVHLLDHNYKDAAELFAKVFEKTQSLRERSEIAINSAYFMGQAKFELGDYVGSAAAYASAALLRPDDPIILNNEGLSLGKAGDFAGAEKLYQRALDLMKQSGSTHTLTFFEQQLII